MGIVPSLAAWAAAGAVQSIGPCVMGRAVSLSALMAGARRPGVVLGLFVVGVMCAYELYLLASPLVGWLVGEQSILFAVMALGMVWGAIVTLRSSEHRHDHGESAHASSGGVFLLGAGSALQLAPCCTLPALGIVAMSSQVGIGFSAGELAAYGFGHAVPLIVLGVGGLSLSRMFRGLMTSRGVVYVNATMLVFLAVYFGVQV